MSILQTGKMIYRNFGNSGLKISAISVGNMVNYKPETYQEDKKIIQASLKAGINHFDTAETYSHGDAERQLGKILIQLKVPRDQVVIATKIYTSDNPQRNSTASTNRKHIKQGVKKSLIALQMDYVDILYAHLHDHATPLEEICRGFHQVIEEGQAFYWATSNWQPEVVFHALAICEKLNLHKPIGAQCQYNMLTRKTIQIDYESLFKKYNYGLIAWSPLAGGYLTGKYNNGIPENEVNRFNDKNFFFPLQVLKQLYLSPHDSDKVIKIFQELQALVTPLGHKLSHLAIAWVVKYQYASSALIGARNVAQLQDSLKALQLLEKFTPEFEGKVNKILGNTPTSRINFIKGFPFQLNPPSRPVAAE